MSSSLLAGRTIAVAYRSPFDISEAWSGTVSAVACGLHGLGADVHLINAEPPKATAFALKVYGVLRAGRTDWSLLPEIMRAHQATARHRGRGRRFDAIVQCGSDFGAPLSGPLITLEDMTVAQAVSLPGGYELSAETTDRWRRRQGGLYTRAEVCLVSSSWARHSVVEDYGVSPDKVHVVGFGRNLDVAPAERDWSVPRFLFVGIDWERKNGPALLDAFSRLHGELPNATLDVVGGHPPIDQAGVTGHGLLRRKVPAEEAQLRELWARATCFVMPSLWEPFALAHLEAMGAGIPSIGTTRGGVSESIGDGGLVVEPDDPDALLAALRDLSRPERAQALGAVALERSRLFTWELFAERVARSLPLPGLDKEGLAPFLEQS